MAKVKVVDIADIETKYGLRTYIQFNYIGELKSLFLSDNVKNYHKVDTIPIGTTILVTKRVKESSRGEIREFFILDEIIYEKGEKSV